MMTTSPSAQSVATNSGTWTTPVNFRVIVPIAYKPSPTHQLLVNADVPASQPGVVRA